MNQGIFAGCARGGGVQFDANKIGQCVQLLGPPSDGKYLAVGATVQRSQYPELSDLYPTLHGIQATTVGLPAALTWSNVAYNGSNLYVMVARDSSYCATSSDGINWTATTTMPASRAWNAVAYGNGVFVAVANSNVGKIAYSSDGVSWTEVTPALADAQYDSVGYVGTSFVVTCSNYTNRIYTSPNGVAWTLQTPTYSPNSAGKMCSNGSVILYIRSATSTNLIQHTTDGITVSNKTLPATQVWTFCFWTGTMFVAGGASATYATSPDGSTWTARTSPGSITQAAGAGSGNVMVVCGTNANIHVSFDGGLSWTTHTLPSNQTYKTAFYREGTKDFVVIPQGSPGNLHYFYFGYSPTITLSGTNGWYVRVK